MAFAEIVPIVLLVLALILIYQGVKIVPQAEEYTVERFGRYTKTLTPGVHFIVPFIDRVSHRVSILIREERFAGASVITRDNVEIDMDVSIFFRIVDTAKSQYRIADLSAGINTLLVGNLRAVGGKMELDEIQANRADINQRIFDVIMPSAEEWGIEVTGVEIRDVKVDEATRHAMQQQLNAERTRRAQVIEAEGRKRAVELNADADLYEKQKEAQAIFAIAEANANAVRVAAEADAHAIAQVAEAIRVHGDSAVRFDIAKRQVSAMGQVAAARNSKTVIMPTDIANTIGSLAATLDSLESFRSKPGEIERDDGPGHVPQV